MVRFLTPIILLSYSLFGYSQQADFNSYEFTMPIDNFSTEAHDKKDKLYRKISNRLNDFEIIGPIKKYEVYFLDDELRTLKEHQTVVRIRKNIKSPKKSTITLKKRTSSLTELEYLDKDKFDDYKFEIDITPSKDSYSLSYEIYFNSKKDIKKVRPKKVLKYLKKNNKYSYELITDILHASDMSIPKKVVRKKIELRYVGDLALLKEYEFDFEVWYFPDATADISLSFKTDSSNIAQLRQQFQALFLRINTGPRPIEDNTKTEQYWID